MTDKIFATLHTNVAAIRLELFPNHAPKTVANFVELAEGTREYTDPRTGAAGSGPYYDGTIFHRVIPGFMIQAGDPTGTGRGGPGYTFNDEIHPELHFDRPYLLAMANAGKRRRQRHQRLAVLHHRRADRLAELQAHDLRRGRRRRLAARSSTRSRTTPTGPATGRCRTS